MSNKRNRQPGASIPTREAVIGGAGVPSAKVRKKKPKKTSRGK